MSQDGCKAEPAPGMRWDREHGAVYLRRAISSRSSPLLTHLLRCLEWNLSSLLCSFCVLKSPSSPCHQQMSLTSGWTDSKLQAPRGVSYDPLHPARTSRPSKDISPVFYSLSQQPRPLYFHCHSLIGFLFPDSLLHQTLTYITVQMAFCCS